LNLIYEGSQNSYNVNKLRDSACYYWKVEISDNYGLSLISPVQRFNTIAPVQKSFNYPNPFNPALGQSTKIVFNMPEDGLADISVYTEMGDLCWRKTFANLSKGSNEISYNGMDDNGQILYNGSYVCVIDKKYSSGSSIDKTRILILK
jgi:hypothetical protein